MVSVQCAYDMSRIIVLHFCGTELELKILINKRKNLTDVLYNITKKKAFFIIRMRCIIAKIKFQVFDRRFIYRQACIAKEDLKKRSRLFKACATN